MATIEDAINIHIQYCEKQIHPSHNPLINREIDVWISTLKSAPRHLVEIEKLIDRKEQMRQAALSPEQIQTILTEIQALEWVRMILWDSDKDCDNCWSLLALPAK